jgi:predicted transcriptional regulator YdeE
MNQEKFRVIGLALPKKTTNENNQSMTDCGSLCEQFSKNNYGEKIPGRLDDSVLAIYHQYDGDHTKPFSYFIGCKVNDSAQEPQDMRSLTVPSGNYQKFTARGKMPDCIADAWKKIWESGLDRAYVSDYEVYDKRSHDWNDAEVDIYISIR